MQEVWIVDVNDERIEVYRSPEAGEYTERRFAGRSDRLICPDFPDVVLTVDDIPG